MLLLSNELVKKQVLSLRSSTPIASVLGPIINPNNLKIEGFYCRDIYSKNELVLVSQDIREVIDNGYIVNDHDVLVPAEDLVRLKDILKLNFVLIGKQVDSISKTRIGKVEDYATDLDSMFVQKLYITPPIYKHFGGGSKIIDRSQINEITPKRIIVNDPLARVPAQAKASVV